jgi:hypothetical protein
MGRLSRSIRKVLIGKSIALTAWMHLIASAPSPKPVPAKWLQNGRLVVPELNFSVGSLSFGSAWSYLESDAEDSKTLFILDSSHGTRYVVGVLAEAGRMSARNEEEFTKGIKRSLPNGSQIEGHEFETSDVPIKDSTKYKITILMPNHSLLYAYGYIVSGKHGYALCDYTLEATEPAEFTRFVSSFALLSPSANQRSANPFVGIMVILAVTGAILDWKYKKRGGRRPTRKDRLAFGLLVIASGVFVAFLLNRGAEPEIVGDITGMLLALLLLCWEIGRWRIRRKYPVSHVSPTIAADMVRTE